MKISIPSLHLVGFKDRFLVRSMLLYSNFYDEKSTTIIGHGETHQVPSIKTNIYPAIKGWLTSKTKET